MKKFLIFFILGGFLLFPLHITFAYFDEPGSSSLNPIYIKVQPQPSLPYSTSAELKQQIQQQYGYDAYQSCRNKSSACRINMGDPQNEQSCLMDLAYGIGKFCLQKYNSSFNSSPCQDGLPRDSDGSCVRQIPRCPVNATYINNSCQCNAGYILSGANCWLISQLKLIEDEPPQPTLTTDQQCKNAYGSYSYGSGGKCYCSTGYEWTSDRKSCIPTLTPTPAPTLKPAPTIDQRCKNTYGSFSYGRDNQCYCSSGYEWTSDKKSCVTLTKSNEQICKDAYGVQSVWDGSIGSNGSINCGCANGYTWNGARTSCVPMIVEPVQPPEAPKEIPVVKIPVEETVRDDLNQAASVNMFDNEKFTPAPDQDLKVKKVGFWSWLSNLFGFKTTYYKN